MEDEAGLRKIAATLLEAGGYRVLKAGNAAAALTLVQPSAQEIDLVVTDVIMPTMSGVELCNRLRELRPGIRLLYMSGYAADQLDRYGQFNPGVPLLEKPFTKRSLLMAVRKSIDNERTGGTGGSGLNRGRCHLPIR